MDWKSSLFVRGDAAGFSRGVTWCLLSDKGLSGPLPIPRRSLMPAQNAVFLLKLLGMVCTGQERRRGCQPPSLARLHRPHPAPCLARDHRLLCPRDDDLPAALRSRAHRFVLRSLLIKIAGQGPFSLDACRAARAGPRRGRCLRMAVTALLVLAAHQLVRRFHLSGCDLNNQP